MFDAALRRAYAPATARVASLVHGRSIRAVTITATGLVLGLGAAGAAGTGRWWLALGLWLVSRAVDGLDGAVARLEGPSARGAFADLLADFTVYAAFVAGIAVEIPQARLAAVVLLSTYYVSGAAFLAWSSLADGRSDGRSADHGRSGLEIDDDRTVRFVGGLAEGFETVAAYAIVCVWPVHAETILWVFAALVGITALQRVVFALRDLELTPDRGRH